jgi:hypothetical protein
MRKAFGMEFAAGLADNFSTPWSGLSLGKQKIFETYNISEKDWMLLGQLRRWTMRAQGLLIRFKWSELSFIA